MPMMPHFHAVEERRYVSRSFLYHDIDARRAVRILSRRHIMSRAASITPARRAPRRTMKRARAHGAHIHIR